ncbi:MAG: dihydroorotase family protein [Candidatus Moraniibacteriota bacterium]
MNPQIETFHLPEDILDSHVHLRGWKEHYKTTPFQVLWEGFQSLITVSVAMPNTWPVIDSLQAAVEYLKNEINPAARVIGMKRPQLLYAGLTDNNFKEVIRSLKLPQVVGGKIIPSGEVTTGKLGIAKDSSIRWHMNNIAEAGKVLAVHCADPLVFKKRGCDTIEGEVKYLEKILRLAYPLREYLGLVICHVSCKASAELILQAQREGYRNLFMGVTPHHLWFDNEGTNWNPNLDPVFYYCFNGLRGPEERKYLVGLLADEEIENIIIESDSACHTTEEKLRNKLGGFPSNQEMVPLMITLAKKHGISEKRVADLICFNPARLFKIDVSRKMFRYLIEKRVDRLQYNNGIVTNPWADSEQLYFPIKRAS